MSKRTKRASEAPSGEAASPEHAPADHAPETSALPDTEGEVAEEAAATSDAAGEEGSAPVGEAGAEPAGENASETKRAKAVGPPPPPERLVGAIEALLLAAGEVLTAARLRDVLGLPSQAPVREALEQVRARWQAAGLSIELQDVAGGVRVVTRPEYAEYVRRMQRHVNEGRLSQGQLETLSIVAYRQPVARPEIERIRGVQVGETLRALLDKRLVKVVGRSDQPGRPLLYGTTSRFLTAFGLNDVKDLPSARDLARL
jgi:segregation and condensation protein B